MRNDYHLNQGFNPHWVCICGQKNHHTRTHCLNCHISKLSFIEGKNEDCF